MRAYTGGVLTVVAVWAMPVYGQGAAASLGDAKQPLPYTAEYDSTIERTAPDGKVTVQVAHEVRAADSQGREYNANTQFAPLGDRERITNIVTSDPQLGIVTSWDSPGQVATVRKVLSEEQLRSNGLDCSLFYATPEGSVPPSDAEDADPDRIATATFKSYSWTSRDHAPIQIPKPERHVFETAKVDLGTKRILGIEAHGTLMTRINPAGSTGKDESGEYSTETWTAMSDVPGDPVLRKVSVDPAFGRITTEIVNLRIGEPELSLFLPPDSYEIANEQMHRAPCPPHSNPSQ